MFDMSYFRNWFGGAQQQGGPPGGQTQPAPRGGLQGQEFSGGPGFDDGTPQEPHRPTEDIPQASDVTKQKPEAPKQQQKRPMEKSSRGGNPFAGAALPAGQTAIAGQVSGEHTEAAQAAINRGSIAGSGGGFNKLQFIDFFQDKMF